MLHQRNSLIFFFNDTATTEIYTLSLHDALPISTREIDGFIDAGSLAVENLRGQRSRLKDMKRRTLDVLNQLGDRKSTRLNSSHLVISYAVFCLKKKKIWTRIEHTSLRPSKRRTL